MLKRLLEHLDGISRTMAVVLALLLTVMLGLLDYFTGYELSFSLFYLFPVSLVAWRLGGRAGVLVSVLDALTWHFANALTGQDASNPLVPYWNTLTRFGFFCIVTLLLAQLRLLLDEEKSFARTDGLTKALNGRAFREAISTEIVRATRYDRPLTLVYIDLDNFKTVNDTLGHGAGDALLRVTVTLIRNELRPTDLIGRLGGDEFSLLFPETDADSAALAISRMRDALRVEMERNQWPVTLSVGVLTCLKPFAPAEKLIHQADELMYRAKRSGKNAVEYATYQGE